MLITSFAFCLEMWDVIWKMWFKFVLCRDYLKRFILVFMLDHFMISFFWSSNLILTNDACSFSIIEWRMSVFDLSSDVYDETLSLIKHFIKFDKNDSSNLTKATHEIWLKRFIKLDEKKRHFIRFNESVISSSLRSSSHQIFEKKDNFFTFWWVISCQYVIWEKFNLAEDHFLLCEIVMINERSDENWRWYNSIFS
jgi:hypothetical protein